MPSRRQERVGKRVMQELVDALRTMKNVELGFTTITRCEVSPDLRHAKVFVSVFGDEDVRNRTLDALKRHASRLKGMIGRPLGTKVVPSLHFEFDEIIEQTDKMSRLIRDARATDVNQEPLTPEELAELSTSAAAGKYDAGGGFVDVDADAFEQARQDVREELFGDDEDDDSDDADWKPINLDELPEE